jgi:histidinol-phosphate aminotransferase
MLKPRNAVRDMAPYTPPTGGRHESIRLDFNENTVGCSPAVVEFLKTHLTAEALSIYPEYVTAKPEIAAFFGVAPEEILFTNGTDEAIQVFINTYVDPGEEILTLSPSYAMYRFYADIAGARVREVPLGENFAFPLEAFLAAIEPGTRAILIANPNNPTGTGTSAAAIEQIVEAAPHAAVFIDEAYYDFSGETILPRLSRFPNAFVSRTFSKVYGMAAMRFGCVFSHAANIQFLHKAQSPFSVNTLAALAARAAIRDQDFVRDYAAQVVAAREMIFRGLADLKIYAYPSQANFILFHAGDRAIEIRDELRRRRVLVRDRSYEIPGTVRVTAGTRAHAEKFLQELRAIW